MEDTKRGNSEHSDEETAECLINENAKRRTSEYPNPENRKFWKTKAPSVAFPNSPRTKNWFLHSTAHPRTAFSSMGNQYFCEIG
jgi:hypothetical protein